MKKTVLVGITSGIAAYKVLTLIKLLMKEQININVIMTKNATQVVSPKEIEKISGNKVFTELFEDNLDYKKILVSRTVDHINLADGADLMVIVPATANSIAKLACGIADDFLTTTALAVTKPILICPSMNVNMWNNPVTQGNISTLHKRGYFIIGPAVGQLACGYEGIGRLFDISLIKDEIINVLHHTTSLKGKKIIVTAGATIEKIDDVRYITNRSTGKMGVAIAEECYLRGAEVLLLHGKNSKHPRFVIKEKIFTSGEDLSKLIREHIKNYDYIYHVAAVGDFAIENKVRGKITSRKKINLILIPQVKIVNQIKKLAPRIVLIAFKAEYDLSDKKLIQIADKKLKESHADFIVTNDISKDNAGFEVDTNEVCIISRNHRIKKISNAPKRTIAKEIIDFITDMDIS